MPDEMYLETEKIVKGSTILEEKPFVYTLCMKFRTNRCDFCFKQTELLKCSNCKYVYYCNIQCQKDAWNVHKLECKHLKKISPRILPNAARILARLIKILSKGGKDTKSYYSKRGYRTFKDLMSHYSEIKNDTSRMEHLTCLYKILLEFFEDETIPNFVEIMCMFGRMCVNSFSICTQDLQSIGTGMYLAASIVDHSCQPNAVVTFEGTKLVMRNTEDLSRLDWSKIFISYIDIIATTEERQKELQATYYFLCQCVRCVEPEPIKEMLGAACPNGCDICIDIINDKECGKCKCVISQDFVDKYNEVMEMTQIHLENMKETTFLDVCNVCLNAHKNVLYKYNIRHVKIMDLAFDSSIEFGKFDDAIRYGKKLVPCFLKYYGKMHPLNGVLHLKLGKLLLYQENVLKALEHFKIAKEILEMTHGKCSSIFKEHLLPLFQQAILEAKTR